MMKVGCIGGGAREHVIAEALCSSGAEIYAVMANRNPGIIRLARDYVIEKETNIEAVARWCKSKNVALAVIGPEAPLVAGLADALEAQGISVVGPQRSAAEIEASKAFMRDLMTKYRIEGNLDYHVFDDIVGLKKFLKDYDKEVAIKPAGLTGGKGVKIMGEHLKTINDAISYAEEVMRKKIGGGRVVVEERAEGEEYTLQAFTDGDKIAPMPLVQDHKRAYEGDLGPNTGGMGSYSQENGLLPFITAEEYEKSVNILQKIVDALKSEGRTYRGIIYGQFMLTSTGPKIIEVNCRFGDPEAMNVLPLLQANFVDICEEIAHGGLSPATVRFNALATVCKYVVPKGYGTKPVENTEIKVNEAKVRETGAHLYYASVNEIDGRIYTTRSRSMAVLGVGSNIEEAEQIAESGLKHISGNVYVRHDIGKKAVIERKVQHMKKIKEKSFFSI